MKNTQIIIITGGIGCGKSVVSRLLQVMGYPVYDCDLEAKQLMNTDPILKEQLTSTFGPDTYQKDGTLNKPHLASLIFNNKTLLTRIDQLVHPAVGRDIEARRISIQAPYLFVETAIYYESGFGQFISPAQVWCVASPLELRISRAMVRDNTPREKILARINSQMSQEEKTQRADAIIWNDNTHSLILQVNALLKFPSRNTL